MEQNGVKLTDGKVNVVQPRSAPKYLSLQESGLLNHFTYGRL